MTQKDGRREVIEVLVVGLIIEAIDSGHDTPDTRAVARERDAAVGEMHTATPAATSSAQRVAPRVTDLPAQKVSRGRQADPEVQSASESRQTI